jgi:hypothetical protein
MWSVFTTRTAWEPKYRALLVTAAVRFRELLTVLVKGITNTAIVPSVPLASMTRMGER